MGWDPVQYLKYGGERIRPAVELLARVPAVDPRRIYDLGCGPGNSTALLASRWPAAHLTGVDQDCSMLGRARQSAVKARWEQTDIGQWAPAEPADIIFSNAALHWLDNHQLVFPRLAGLLAPGGVLAVQMPRNHAAPSHALMRDIARRGPWASQLAPLLRDRPVSAPEVYYRWLAPHLREIEIWETTYLMRLTGSDPVLSWIRGTALSPLLQALEEKQATAFEATLAESLREAYPPEKDGATLFPFRRQFIIGIRP